MGVIKLNRGLAHWYFHFLFIWLVRYFSFFLFKWWRSLFFFYLGGLQYTSILLYYKSYKRYWQNSNLFAYGFESQQYGLSLACKFCKSFLAHSSGCTQSRRLLKTASCEVVSRLSHWDSLGYFKLLWIIMVIMDEVHSHCPTWSQWQGKWFSRSLLIACLLTRFEHEIYHRFSFEYLILCIVLVWEIVEPLGDGDLLEEVSHDEDGSFF